MRIGYFADGIWSHLALEKMVSDSNFKISFIVLRHGSSDETLKTWALRLSVPWFEFTNINSKAAIDKLRAFECDIYVSMSFDQIFRKDILAIPPLGIINCHAGALPFYRGRNVLNWVLINDEKKFGITVHYVDLGIDTGDIIRQRFAKITDKDTYKTLLTRASELCASELYLALTGILKSTATRRPQSTIHPVGTYFSKRVDGDEWVNWAWSSRKIFNFIRAISDPGPNARAMVGERILLIGRAAMIPHAPSYIANPGEVVAKSGGNPIVKTGDTTILLEKYEVVTGSNCFSQSIKIPVGTRLKNAQF